LKLSITCSFIDMMFVEYDQQGTIDDDSCKVLETYRNSLEN
jgi:hypothetical protein